MDREMVYILYEYSKTKEKVNLQLCPKTHTQRNHLRPLISNVFVQGSGDSVMAVWEWQDDTILLDDCVGDMFEAGMSFRKRRLQQFFFTLTHRDPVGHHRPT